MRHGEHHGHKHHGAQTFRRGRALEFLQRLDVKRETLIQQLAQPELQAIHQVLSGELKAIELVRNEFIEFFDLRETRKVEKEHMRDEERGGPSGSAGNHEERREDSDAEQDKGSE
ncbi:hypothetical protein [Alicyclobacillus kakegawensis]|uniref:hypothetical protein n=1 Tax=Alicyclobacillus kakegawensis TaxID=392012 RepID=UPI000835B69B|nr:hypothetical protein [Alicyclobacillus kakegawensis]